MDINDADEIRRLLQSNKLEVTFTKKNGESRVMNCTTHMGTIPDDKHPKGTGSPSSNPDIVKVFDLDKEEWRSFDASTVTNVVVMNHV